MDVIRLRRSIKPELMKTDPVDRDLVEQLLEAANWAPSHGRTEPWRFVVFTNEARLDLARVVAGAETGSFPVAETDPTYLKLRQKMTNAPVIIAIVCNPSPNPKIEPHEELASVAMAVQNMHLCAQALGLGGFWSSGKKAFHPAVASFLKITTPAHCLGFFYVGWPAIPWPKGERGPVTHKVTWRDRAELSI